MYRDLLYHSLILIYCLPVICAISEHTWTCLKFGFFGFATSGFPAKKSLGGSCWWLFWAPEVGMKMQKNAFPGRETLRHRHHSHGSKRKDIYSVLVRVKWADEQLIGFRILLFFFVVVALDVSMKDVSMKLKSWKPQSRRSSEDKVGLKDGRALPVLCRSTDFRRGANSNDWIKDDVTPTLRITSK